MAGLNADDRRTMERMRLLAIKRVRTGEPVPEIAKSLGVDKSNVYKWIKSYNVGGLGALTQKKARGAPPKLSVTRAAELRALIVGADPRQLQFEFALWTREMVGVLIERRYGVRMGRSAVGRLLRSMGLSPQRPLWRAYQANPDGVERWKTEEFPRIRAEAQAADALVFFGDEASVRSDYHGGTTSGEVGHTPVVTTTGTHHRVNMISAVSPQGKLHFRVVEGTVDADVFIAYCQALLDDYPGRVVYLIVDGHPSHRAKKTKAWVADQRGRIKLVLLPAYSPQLNPDEWVWKNVKHDRIGRAGITSQFDLHSKVLAALHRIAGSVDLIKGFFGDPDLRYITA